MKIKPAPIETKSPDYLEQACYERLNPEALKWAKDKVKEFKEFSDSIPYGLIHKVAIDLFHKPKTFQHDYTNQP